MYRQNDRRCCQAEAVFVQNDGPPTRACFDCGTDEMKWCSTWNWIEVWQQSSPFVVQYSLLVGWMS